MSSYINKDDEGVFLYKFLPESLFVMSLEVHRSDKIGLFDSVRIEEKIHACACAHMPFKMFIPLHQIQQTRMSQIRTDLHIQNPIVQPTEVYTMRLPHQEGCIFQYFCMQQ